MASDDRILVPVADSTTLRQTVEYAVDAALDAGDGYVRFVYVSPAALRDRAVAAGARPSAGADADDTGEGARDDTGEGTPSESDSDPELPGSELLDRVALWAEEDAGTREEALRVDTATIGTEEYLFSPEDVTAALAEDARRHDVGRLLLDPEYDPGIGTPLLQPLQYQLARYEWLRVEEAPIGRRTRRGPLPARTSALQIGALFGLSFVFYQVLAGTLVPLDLVTGAISATIVAVGLSRITLTTDPTVGTLTRIVRMAIYTPYLVYEILKANVAVAAVILHPRLPIDPRMTRIDAAVWGALPVTTLANSITLTPGTLSVRVRGRSLTVHTLIPGAREDLFDGGLERGVRFVFYGRRAMSIGSPRERGDTEMLQPPADGSDDDAGGAPGETEADAEAETGGGGS